MFADTNNVYTRELLIVNDVLQKSSSFQLGILQTIVWVFDCNIMLVLYNCISMCWEYVYLDLNKVNNILEITDRVTKPFIQYKM